MDHFAFGGLLMGEGLGRFFSFPDLFFFDLCFFFLPQPAGFQSSLGAAHFFRRLFLAAHSCFFPPALAPLSSTPAFCPLEVFVIFVFMLAPVARAWAKISLLSFLLVFSLPFWRSPCRVLLFYPLPLLPLSICFFLGRG